LDERLSRALRAFDRLARVVARSHDDVPEVLERVAGEFRDAFAFERALLARLRTTDETVQAVVQQGFDWPGDEWLDLQALSFLEQALEAGRAILVHDARAESAMPPELIERLGICSIAAVPLLIDGRCLGFFVGDRTGGPFELSDDELAVLSTLGVVAAGLVEKADRVAQLDVALAEARELDQAKSNFVSNASHELRTPIAVAHGIAATLYLRGGELLDEQIFELRSTLYEHTSRLRSLADQLLDLSQLDAHAVALRRERFPARERLDALVGRIAHDRTRDVSLAVPPGLELEADPLAFELVVSNLLDNALRYGRPPIEVRVANGNAVRLVVEDCGDGVEPAFVPRLFERFTRSTRSRGRRPEGAGLGLAIAASSAEAMGGRLSYEPATPSGARFTFELPG
jgi:signal transduction histidine kinase